MPRLTWLNRQKMASGTYRGKCCLQSRWGIKLNVFTTSTPYRCGAIQFKGNRSLKSTNISNHSCTLMFNISVRRVRDKFMSIFKTKSLPISSYLSNLRLKSSSRDPHLDQIEWCRFKVYTNRFSYQRLTLVRSGITWYSPSKVPDKFRV